MPLILEPARVASGSTDEERYLVRADGQPVAVLVRRSDGQGGLAGSWFLEAGFGRYVSVDGPVFKGLAEAEAWVQERLRKPCVTTHTR